MNRLQQISEVTMIAACISVMSFCIVGTVSLMAAGGFKGIQQDARDIQEEYLWFPSGETQQSSDPFEDYVPPYAHRV